MAEEEMSMEEYDDDQRMSIESLDDGSDADAEISDKEGGEPALHGGDENDDDDENDSEMSASLPGTPVSLRRRRRDGRRERLLESAWEMKKRREAAAEGEGECRVLVQRRGRGGCLPMDMEEVRACRDLGLELPDWTVEIPGWFSGSTADTSSGGHSPIAACRISSPGNDPTDVKARLKAWAQAVALASTSSFSG